MPLTTTPSGAITLPLLSTITLGGAEISAFDPGTKRLYVTSSNGLQVVDFANPSAPVLLTTISFTSLGFISNDVSSVDVKNGVVAVALIAPVKTDPGQVVLLNTADNAVLSSVTVGTNPDDITFTPDGLKILVANEGEIAPDGTDPAGSVSIISLAGGAASPVVQTAGFTQFDGQEAALRSAGVRIFAGKSVSVDVEPEYVAVSADGATAFVTLQEANAIGILDIATATFTAIVPLGLKDFTGLLADFSDRDSTTGGTAIALKSSQPVFGLYMPDAIASYSVGGETFYVTANEGDDRDDFLNPDETIRVGAAGYDLDNAIFPNETALKANGSLGRLTVSNAPGLRGDTDGDGDVDRILTYGARSFSILNSTGAIVFDSADIIERIIAAQPGLFDDGRSDNKGPEPEGIAVMMIGGRAYAFVGLERSPSVLIFDVTDPADVTYVNITSRTGDLNPEGVLTISAADSPTGQPLLVVSNEVSNTISAFAIVPSIEGTAAGEVITGTRGNDIINADGGDDRIVPGGGTDTIDGGPGQDVLDYTTGLTGITLTLGSGGITNVEAVLGSGFNDTIIAAPGAVRVFFSGNAGIDLLTGGDGNDFIEGGDGNDTIVGGVGDDRLYGGAGNDVVAPDGGTNILFGDAGFDTLVYGNTTEDLFVDLGASYVQRIGGTMDQAFGFENVAAGQGDDRVYGTSGDNFIIVGLGSDIAYGEGGIDTISYQQAMAGVFIDLGNFYAIDAGGSTDFLYGFEAAWGSNFADRVYGNGGADNFFLFGGNDIAYGGGGGDLLSGGFGNDLLYGEDGNDSLFGDAGDDLFVGGAGADRFRIEFVSSLFGGPGQPSGNDSVLDFDAAEGDRVQLGSGVAFLGTDASGTVANFGLGTLAALNGHVWVAADFVTG